MPPLAHRAIRAQRPLCRTAGAIARSALCIALGIAMTACGSLPGAGGDSSSSSSAPAGRPGCEKLPTTSNTEKIAIGAAAGAALGLLVGDTVGGPHKGRHRVQGALGGALVGALAGAAFGNEIDVEEQPDGSVKLKIPGSVMFASGQSNLSPGFQDTLSRVTLSIRKYCGVTVRAVGHTDNIGSPAANQALSEARARAVRRYMQTQGFDAQRLSAEGRGQTEPIASNADEVSRQKNRRVELFVRPPAA